jgi:hypothetical protein
LTCRVTGEPLLAGFQKLLRPTVIQALGDALAAAQRGDALLAAKPFKDNADLLFRRMFATRKGFAPPVLAMLTTLRVAPRGP